MYGARTSKRMGSRKVGNFDVQSKNTPGSGFNAIKVSLMYEASEHEGVESRYLLTLMYGASRYERVGSAHVGCLDVRCKSIQEIGFHDVSKFDVQDKNKRVGFRKVGNLDVRGKNIKESGFQNRQSPWCTEKNKLGSGFIAIKVTLMYEASEHERVGSRYVSSLDVRSKQVRKSWLCAWRLPWCTQQEHTREWALGKKQSKNIPRSGFQARIPESRLRLRSKLWCTEPEHTWDWVMGKKLTLTFLAALWSPDLLAVLYVMFFGVLHFPIWCPGSGHWRIFFKYTSVVRCGTSLYWFLTFAFFLTLIYWARTYRRDWLLGKEVTLMLGARTYQRLGSGQEVNINAREWVLGKKLTLLWRNEHEHTRDWFLGKKFTLMYGARSYQRFGSGQEGNIDVQSKNIPEIWFWARR